MPVSLSFVFATSVLVASCGGQRSGAGSVAIASTVTEDLQAIRNDRIQFATMRPPDSTMPTRDRQVVVIAPPEAVALAQRGDIAILDRLVGLLDDESRAWAAQVMLAAMTGHEADLVNDYQSSPQTYFEDVGAGAKERWQKWLDGVRGTLTWDATRRQFVHR